MDFGMTGRINFSNNNGNNNGPAPVRCQNAAPTGRMIREARGFLL